LFPALNSAIDAFAQARIESPLGKTSPDHIRIPKLWQNV